MSADLGLACLCEGTPSVHFVRGHGWRTDRYAQFLQRAIQMTKGECQLADDILSIANDALALRSIFAFLIHEHCADDHFRHVVRVVWSDGTLVYNASGERVDHTGESLW